MFISSHIRRGNYFDPKIFERRWERTKVSEYHTGQVFDPIDHKCADKVLQSLRESFYRTSKKSSG